MNLFRCYVVVQKGVSDSINKQIALDGRPMCAFGAVQPLIAMAITSFAPTIPPSKLMLSSRFQYFFNMTAEDLDMVFGSTVLFATNEDFRSYTTSSSYASDVKWGDLPDFYPWLKTDHQAITVGNANVLVCTLHFVPLFVF